MENVTKLSWLALALIHLAPALVLFFPEMTLKLYGVSPKGEAGVLLVHRGGLFLAIFAAALLAAFFTGMRHLASLIVAISVISFLIIYVRVGLPKNSLRKIAVVDLIALIPLSWVIWQSWFASP